ncbi:MAG: C-terminal target protein [Flavipsychrobacter sp.]|nr:C-terminal target protein [Flavipsychrobacter sp.]
MKKGFYLQSLLVLCFVLFSAVANATLPTITKNPVNKTVCRPDTTYFTTAAIDTPGALAITYSWQVSEDGGVNWMTLTKDTLEYKLVGSDSLVVMTDTSVSGNLYRAIATNTDGADTSAGAMLTVLYPTAGTISGSNVCKAGTTTLGSTVLGGVWMSMNNSIATIGSSTGVVTGVAFGFDTIKYAVTNTCGPDTAMFVIHVDTTLIVAPILGPNVVCKGNFISLTNKNTMFGTGVWSESTGNTTVSSIGSVVGVAQGTDVINYTFTNACNSVSSNKTVSVDTVLDPGTISGATNDVCYGSWISLTASKGGGIWITGSSDIAVVDGSGNVTGVAQGTAVISYIFSNACGVSAATDTITVYANAAMIGGIDSVGIHLTRTLTDSTVGGKWYSSDTSIATIDTFTGVVTGKDTGFTTITYTVTNLCGTSSSYLTLTVGPPPFPGNIYGAGSNFDSSVCKGATLALFDTAKNGTGTWSSTQDTLATVDMYTGVVTGVKPGLDTIVYTFTNALGTSKAIIPIYINIPPVIKLTGPSTVKVGADLIFRATPYQDWTHTPGSIDYPTDKSDVTIGVFTDSNKHMGDFIAVMDSSGLHRTNLASYIVFHGGTDNITYTVKNSCGTSKASYRIFLSTVAVPQVNGTNNSLNVFPNPTDGAVTISLNSDVAEDADVVITNVLGAKVREMKITTNKAYNIRLDQPAGVYFLSASNASGKYDATIVVSK